MSLVEFNFFWMSYNISLAVIAVVCGWLALLVKPSYVKLFFLALWLLFVPNTLYLLSDIIHFSDQVKDLTTSYKTALSIEYGIVMLSGVVSFIAAMYPVGRLLQKIKPFKKKTIHIPFMIFIQFVIAFGIVMGRIERTHSWEVFLNPLKVFHDAQIVITSSQLMLYVLLTGLVECSIYFVSQFLLDNYVVRK